jgi:Glycosyltransferases involved in cell wall biogenesis
MSLITVVVPCYNEEQVLPFLYDELCKISAVFAEKKVTMEYIFVDDGSSDSTLDMLKDYAKTDKSIRYVSFSRNFGKEAAIYAGLVESKGDYVALMDADLQDPPALLPQMYDLIINKDCDCAATFRTTRKGEPKIRSLFARLFYRMINRISKIKMVDGARDFRLMKRVMVDAIIQVTEYNRFSKGIFEWVGFKTEWMPYQNIERVAGKTKWSFWGLFKYSIEGMVAYSTVPLAIASFAGLLFFLLSIAMIIFIIIRTLVWGDPVSGWPSTICIILLVGGIQLFTIGILGQYLSRTYLETKKRPQYIVREKK